MNINLSSVAESPKTVNPAAIEGEDAQLESEQSGGFFTKLAAFIKGEPSSPQDKADITESSEEGALKEAQATPSLDGKNLDTKDLATENQSSDELFVATDAKTDQVAASVDGEDTEALSSALGKQNSESGKTVSLSAEEIVSDNDQVLQRLNVSSKALQTLNGKALPQGEGNQVDSSFSDHLSKKTQQSNTLGIQGQVSTEEGVGISAALNEDGIKNVESAKNTQGGSEIIYSVDGESVTIPASAERFIANSAQEISQSADNKSLSSSQLVIKTDLDEETLTKGESIKSGEGHDLSTAFPPLSSDELVAEEKNLKDADLDEAGLAIGATVLGSAAMVNVGTASASSQMSDSSPSLIAPTQAGSDEQMQEAKVVDTTIPWAADVSSIDEKITQDHSTAKALSTSAAHSTQQAAVSQHSQSQLLSATQSQAAASFTPVESTTSQTSISAMPLSPLTPAQMQAMELASNPATVQDQMALKAMVGAKGTKLGQNSQVDTKQNGETHSGFPQQLAQAAGQQNSIALAQARTEQVAQAPLTLNRELASEQVAERVQMMMSKNLKNIDIRLDPPELGRMQIRMQMNGDATSVHFTVANQQARDVIEQSMPRLREMLAQQGLQLGGSSVQQQASGQQQRSYSDNNQGGSGQTSDNQGFSNVGNLEPDINLDLNVAAKRDGISYYA